MSIGTDAAGGFAVPVLIDPTIIMTAQGSPNDLLRLARVETITNDTWRGLSSAGVSWGFKAEAATSTDNSPTVGQPEVVTRRADGFIPFSIEVGMDWPGFAESMSMLLAEGYDELLAEKLTTGTNGSNEPDGLISSLEAVAASKREVASAGVIAAADVYALWNALPQRFRRAANCAWMSSTDVQNSIRQLGTVDPNFTVDITQEAIPRMFGREYPMNDFMQDDPAGTGTQPLLVVGDFRGYVVAQRAGMTVEFIPMLFDVTNNRPTGQRGWFAWARVGGGVVNSAGFRLLTNRSA
jgi:HK97 family phage major capsid protein